HLRLLSHFLDRLAGTPDGDGSLLDHTLLFYGSGMSNSDLHLPYDVPTIVFGGSTFGVKGGRHVRHPKGTALTNLQIALLDKTGEKLMLTWIANGGTSDTGPVLYIEKYDVTKASNLNIGYILPVEFVSADTAAKTITFKATVPDGAFEAFKSILPRQWMKVTS